MEIDDNAIELNLKGEELEEEIEGGEPSFSPSPSSSSSSSSSCQPFAEVEMEDVHPEEDMDLDKIPMGDETKKAPFPFEFETDKEEDVEEVDNHDEEEKKEREREAKKAAKESKRKRKRETQKRLSMRNLRKEPKITVLPKRILQFYWIYLCFILSLLLTVFILAMVYDYKDDDDDHAKPPLVLLPRLTFEPNALWVGHINPSTDSYCSALAAASLYAGRYSLAGDPAPETQYVIDRFALPPPSSFSDEYNAATVVCLVDHSEKLQSPPFFESFPPNISGIIDNHVQDEGFLTSPTPIVADIRGWGSTSTIVYYHYYKSQLVPPKMVAQCLLSAILSDTIGLKGPTTTNYDIFAANTLNNIARVGSLSRFTRELINSRVPPEDTPIVDVLNIDAKTYSLSWGDGSPLTLRWSTFESADPNFILDRQDKFIKEMKKEKERYNLDFYFLSVIDEMKFFDGSKESFSWLILPTGDEVVVATQAFDQDRTRALNVNPMDVTPLVSRTADFLPPVVDYLREKDPYDWGHDGLSIGLASDDFD